jgi:hypothetical protein
MDWQFEQPSYQIAARKGDGAVMTVAMPFQHFAVRISAAVAPSGLKDRAELLLTKGERRLTPRPSHCAVPPCVDMNRLLNAIPG